MVFFSPSFSLLVSQRCLYSKWKFRKQFIINSIKHKPSISNQLYHANANLNHETEKKRGWERERERERENKIWENLIWLYVTRLIAYGITLELISNWMDDEQFPSLLDMQNFFFIFLFFIIIIIISLSLSHTQHWYTRIYIPYVCITYFYLYLYIYVWITVYFY